MSKKRGITIKNRSAKNNENQCGTSIKSVILKSPYKIANNKKAYRMYGFSCSIRYASYWSSKSGLNFKHNVYFFIKIAPLFCFAYTLLIHIILTFMQDNKRPWQLFESEVI